MKIPSFLILTVIFVALLACTGTTPAPNPTETMAFSAVAATPALPASTTEPWGGGTGSVPRSSMVAPTERSTAAPAATPASSPTLGLTTTPVPDERLAPIVLQDSRSLQSALSEAELGCIGSDPKNLTRALTGAGPMPGGDRPVVGAVPGTPPGKPGPH